MKTRYFSIVLFFFTSFAIGQIDTTQVPFIAYWSVGDSYDFKVSKEKSSWVNGELFKSQEEGYVANFSVIDSTENSYTINWSYQIDLGNSYEIPEDLIEGVGGNHIAEIKYKTTELGEFIDIINLDEIVEYVNQLLDNLTDKLSESGSEKVEENLLALRKLFASGDGVRELILKELKYFHYPYGAILPTDEIVYYEDKVPNLFTGDFIKADVKVFFEYVDFDEGLCLLKQEMILDENDFANSVKNFLHQMKIDSEEFKEYLEKMDKIGRASCRERV